MDDSNPLGTSEAPRVIAGFWRRVFGVFIDSLILGACGLFLGFLFSEVFMQMGPWGANSRLSYCAALLRVHEQQDFRQKQK
jgi:hypothetical protein